jgi:hypothetical protein
VPDFNTKNKVWHSLCNPISGATKTIKKAVIIIIATLWTWMGKLASPCIFYRPPNSHKVLLMPEFLA